MFINDPVSPDQRIVALHPPVAALPDVGWHARMIEHASTLGPTATLILIHFNYARMGRNGGSSWWNADDLGRKVGIGGAQLRHTLNRLERFGMIHITSIEEDRIGITITGYGTDGPR